MPAATFLYRYPLTVVVVGFLIWHYRKSYSELNWKDLSRPRSTLLSIAAGFLVFVLWINMSQSWATFGTPAGYNPSLVSDNFTVNFLIFSRLVGASILVPVMEELFWRSWLLRYLISPNFSNVAIATFSWSSFIIGSLLFGLEHNLWLAGIMAGVAYSLLLYRSKSISQCIVAHATTNFLLGIYVLNTGRWEFW